MGEGSVTQSSRTLAGRHLAPVPCQVCTCLAAVRVLLPTGGGVIMEVKLCKESVSKDTKVCYCGMILNGLVCVSNPLPQSVLLFEFGPLYHIILNLLIF